MEQQESNKTDKPLSNRDRVALKDELISELVAGCQNEATSSGPTGCSRGSKGAVMEKLLEAEMTNHLDHERRKGANSRKGHSVKTVTTETGPVEVPVPRDRRAPSSLSWSRSARAAWRASTRMCWAS